MNQRKLFQTLLSKKQQNFSAQPENSAATACIAHKSLRICERRRLAALRSRLEKQPTAPATAGRRHHLMRDGALASDYYRTLPGPTDLIFNSSTPLQRIV